MDELNFAESRATANEGLTTYRREMIELLGVEKRIKECQQMGREIEEFENRIQKVEEYIRQDDLVMLCQLVVGQLQGRMKLVRDMGKGSHAGTAKDKRGRTGRETGEAEGDGSQ